MGLLVSFRFYFLKMLSFSLVFISFSVSFSLSRNMGYLSGVRLKKLWKKILFNKKNQQNQQFLPLAVLLLPGRGLAADSGEGGKAGMAKTKTKEIFL